VKVLKLLQELYLELKTFNENVEYFTCLKYEKERRLNNPLRAMTDIEKINLKFWIEKCLKEKNITFDGDSYNERSVKSFFNKDSRLVTKSVRNFISAALGYGSFDDLLAAYWQTKGGAA